MSEIVNQFYGAIRSGDVDILDALIDQDFSLICPTQDHVLSGVYRGKHRFFEEVTPHVFGSVESSDITWEDEVFFWWPAEAAVVLTH